jgi:hypothetical protein
MEVLGTDKTLRNYVEVDGAGTCRVENDIAFGG